MRRKGFPPIAILIGIMLALFLVVAVVSVFSDNFLGIDLWEDTPNASDVDACDSAVSAYCSSLPNADWSEAYPDCEEYADEISDGTTACSG